ncbi:hypothetical protein [Desulfotomaculum sp. 1211_IL3151]|uniref:hypothetical protein n=1 Tax=Desulfotomaculum sp. 1211_IL3151 TaxID=3084055 RepID=UPI002FDA6618
MANEDILRQLLETQNKILETLKSHDSKLDALSENLKGLEKSQLKMDHRLSSLENGQVKMTDRLNSLEKGLQKVETRIENELTEKIRGLYDSREVTNDKFDQILNKLTDLENTSDYVLLKLAQHEVKQFTSQRKMIK